MKLKGCDTNIHVNGYNNLFQAKHCSENGGLAIFYQR
jgi:hypothetical protein